MERAAKYVIIDREFCDTAFVFPVWVAHSDVRFKMGGKLLSAGFVRFDEDGAHAYGKSTGLSCHSRPEDSQIISEQLGLVAHL